MTAERRKLIESAFTDREQLKDSGVRDAILKTIDELDRGIVRVAENRGGEWQVNDWVKQAVLLYFLISEMQAIEIGPFNFHDKIPLKRNFSEIGVRAVPPACARYGSFMERGVVLMPSYVNIGAYIGSGTMIDNWALVGSCAQIGRDCHVSAGVVIGGVLEPPSAKPVIIEDGAFIGSGCNVLEGIIVKSEAVLGANVTLTSSTKIIDVSGPTPVEHRGIVPPRAVVVPGSIPKRFPAGEFQVQCALIIGERKESTDRKTSLNEALRKFEVN